MTLVETWWARGGRLLNCSFCSGQQRDSRARDLIQVLRHRALVAIHRAPDTFFFPLSRSHPAAQNVILSPIRQTDRQHTPPSWL